MNGYHSIQMQKEKIIEILKNRGFRITKQRLTLLDIILENEFSCCKEIYYKAVKLDDRIGTATVYRMINTLDEIGAIRRENRYKVACADNCFVEDACSIYLKGIDYHEIIECIVSALDAKDPYTAGHSQRVSDMALKVCKWLGLKEGETEEIHIAAHLHDIGKIGVPDAVLNKADRLTKEEWEYMKKHSQIGAEILSKSHQLNELKEIVLYHHERFDGKGYPEGLKGEQIPLGARIIAICDSIDAITSTRSYRMAHSFEYCYQEIEKNLEKMYDPLIGTCVLKHWDKLL